MPLGRRPHEDGATRVVGLSTLERTRLALKYAGVAEVEVLDAGEPAASVEKARPLVLIAADAVINVAAVKVALDIAGRPAPVTWIGEAGDAMVVVDAENAPAVREAARDGFDVAAAALPTGRSHALTRVVVSCRVSKEGRGGAARALMASLKKPTDSWYSRSTTRNLSRYVSHALSYTPVTPNMLTVCALLAGLAGAWVVQGAGSHTTLIAGFALALLGEVFDCADGELARVTYRFSPYGQWLDTVVDDVVSLALHVAAAAACFRLYDQAWAAYVGWAGAGAFAFYMVVLYYNLVVHVGSGDAGALRWWTDGGSAHEAGAERVGGRRIHLGDLARAMSNRESLIGVYLATSILRVLPVGVLVVAAVAAGLLVVAAGQVIKGYPSAP